ncbi:unnamed protein product [Protopolystoma xenopodis]|uniref:Uncharacterized protein n=1 Tax=Protopolystoma xenopodis TaxID=117903 RepID=A0A3S5CCL1_9PLAT|nr:unnamed protein product [Protopolystoma xenopodis]
MHLQIDSLATPVESYYRLSHALSEVRKVMLPESGEIPPPPWGNQASPVPRGGGPMRGRHPRGRGFPPGPGFPPAPTSFPPPPNGTPPGSRGRGLRGRGIGWVSRGGQVASNGTASSQSATTGDYGNGVDAYPYPQIKFEGEYENAGYEDFGTGYATFNQSLNIFNPGQSETWGKMGGSDARGRGRGRGRSHPYARPALKDDAQ